MKRSELTFMEGFTSPRSKNNNPQRVFDWDKAGEIINKLKKEHSDLIAEAGLQGDWDYTGGVIFEDGKEFLDSCTYLSSNWAVPTLLIYFDGKFQNEIPCWSVESECRFDQDSKWDEESLSILNK